MDNTIRQFYNVEITEADKSTLSNWISNAKADFESYRSEIEQADAYMDGEQIPSGFTSDIKAQVEKANAQGVGVLNTAQKNYIVINEIIKSHDRILGEFIKAERRMEVSGRTLKDRKRSTVLRRSMKMVEEINKTWMMAVVPAIDSMFHRGLGWVKSYLDPFVSLPNGKIVEEYVSPRWIMIDPTSSHPFYDDTQFRAHVRRIRKNDAIEMMGSYPGFDPVKLTSDAQYQKTTEETQGEWCTFYEVHFPVEKMHYYKVDEEQKLQEIEREEYLAGEDVIAERKRIFRIGLYNVSQGGLFHLMEADVNSWQLTPFINRRSERRAYGQGDFLTYKNLQDIFNIVQSLILDDVKRGRKFIGQVSAATYQKHKALLERVEVEGGWIPDINAKITPLPGLNTGVLTLLQLIKQDIDDIRSLPEVSQGKLPAKQISSETVSALMASAVLTHGRKDAMINVAITMMAMARSKLITKFWKSEEWIKVNNKPGDDEYIPINKMLVGKDQYYEEISAIFDIPIPKGEVSDEEAQAFQSVKKKFEKENDIQVKTEDFHNVDGKVLTSPMYEKMIGDSGLLPENFVKRHSVVSKKEDVYYINFLNEDVDCDISYTIDFDTERTKQMMKAIMLQLFDRMVMHPVTMMSAIGVENAQEEFEKAQGHFQALGMAKKIMENPKFQHAVQLAEQLLANPEAITKITESMKAAGGIAQSQET